jgi:hypothetical protein
MEQRVKRPVVISFSSHQEAIDMYIAIEFKFFVQKLLYSHTVRSV